MGQCGASYNEDDNQPLRSIDYNRAIISDNWDGRPRSNNLTDQTHSNQQRWRAEEKRPADNNKPPQDVFIPASRQKATPSGWSNKPQPAKITMCGHKYSYQAHREKWLKIPVKIAIEVKHFNQGGMRLVYRCEELIEKDNSRILSCAKIFKDGEGPQAYFDEAMTQMVAESYAQQFNRECSKKELNYNVGFVPVAVLHVNTPDGRKKTVQPRAHAERSLRET